MTKSSGSHFLNDYDSAFIASKKLSRVLQLDHSKVKVGVPVPKKMEPTQPKVLHSSSNKRRCEKNS
jgi:hypothetical protein